MCAHTIREYLYIWVLASVCRHVCCNIVLCHVSVCVCVCVCACTCTRGLVPSVGESHEHASERHCQRHSFSASVHSCVCACMHATCKHVFVAGCMCVVVCPVMSGNASQTSPWCPMETAKKLLANLTGVLHKI